MNFLRDMKVRSKLVLGFFMVLLGAGVIAGVGSYGIMSVNTAYSYMLRYPVIQQNLLRDIEVGMMEARRVMNRASMYASEVYGDGSDEEANARTRSAGIAIQEETLAGRRADLVSYFTDYRNSLQSDERLDPAERASQLSLLASLEEDVFYYIDHYIARTMGYAIQGDSMAAIEITRGAVETVNSANSYFESLMNAKNDRMHTVNQDLTNQAQLTFAVLVALAVVLLFLGAVFAFIISNMIAKPLHKIHRVLGEVAVGNLNVNIDKKNISKDEVGELTSDVNIVVETLKSITDDMIRFSNETNKNGDIEYRIDASKYKGGYKEMVDGINTAFGLLIEDVLTLLDVMNNINKGNFNAEIKKLPGKKAVLNDTVDYLTANLKSIEQEILDMVNAAVVLGDLQYSIDVDKYEGDWRTVMQGLDDIAKAVDVPLVEIRDVVARFNAGYFDKLMEGDYAGDFLSIKNDINGLITDVGSYINEIDSCLDAFASGDLTRNSTMKFEGEFDKIGKSINKIAGSLHTTMAEISAASGQVLLGANQISTSAMDLANGATEQASSVEELNASIDMINHQTKENAANAEEATSLSNKSTQYAGEGNDNMKQMLEAMLQIKESSSSISRIIKVIQDIAFQTNLLALNAAVEAARAGEHGKGFAVVAEEVRNLAARSQEAATETTGLIEDSINRVEAGSGIAETTSETLDVIVSNANEVLQIINSISSASKEQTEAIGQISAGINQISSVVQSNSAVSEETAAAAEELNSQAEVLRQLVAYFKV